MAQRLCWFYVHTTMVTTKHGRRYRKKWVPIVYPITGDYPHVAAATFDPLPQLVSAIRDARVDISDCAPVELRCRDADNRGVVGAGSGPCSTCRDIVVRRMSIFSPTELPIYVPPVVNYTVVEPPVEDALDFKHGSIAPLPFPSAGKCDVKQSVAPHVAEAKLVSEFQKLRIFRRPHLSRTWSSGTDY